MSENPTGRPTLYDPKYCEEIIEYFGVTPYEERIITKLTKSGDVIEIPEDVAADFPSFAGFAAKIGVCRDTLHEWCKKHPIFSDAYKKAKELQENFILVNGNRGLINTAFGIFTAKNVLGYRDRHPDEVDRTVINNNLQEKPQEEIDKRLEELEKLEGGE